MHDALKCIIILYGLVILMSIYIPSYAVILQNFGGHPAVQREKI